MLGLTHQHRISTECDDSPSEYNDQIDDRVDDDRSIQSQTEIIDLNLSIPEPKLIQVGRWLVPENDPMLGAIIAMERSVTEWLNQITEIEDKQEKMNDSHHP